MKKIILACAIAMFATAANATDFTAKIMDDDGKPMCAIALADGACQKFFTIGLAVRSALDAQPNMQGLTPQEKDRRGELSQGLIGASNPILLDADVKMIKDAIGNAYPPSIVHKVWKMLDEDAKAKAEAEKAKTEQK